MALFRSHKPLGRAVAVLLAFAGASGTDNQVLCPGAGERRMSANTDGGGGRTSGLPSDSELCVTAPCNTPSLALAVSHLEPAFYAAGFVLTVSLHLKGLHAPAPPTPPPKRERRSRTLKRSDHDSGVAEGGGPFDDSAKRG